MSLEANDSVKKWIDLRHKLHQHAELSHREISTRQIIRETLDPFRPDKTIELASGKGLLFVWDSGLPGPHTMFRADQDALPIKAKNSVPYQNKDPGVSHKCGHDGHMAVIASLAGIWQKDNYCGSLSLLFQHAEEVGEGAAEICEDAQFQSHRCDQLFGFHNLPGFPIGSVVTRRNTFSCASCGIKMNLQGRSAHAAEPELADSPLPLAQKVIEAIAAVNNNAQHNDEYFLATLTHLRLGAESFGITPGHAEIYITVRSSSDELLLKYQTILIEQAYRLAESIKVSHELIEPFPAVVNHIDEVKMLEKAAQSAATANSQIKHIDLEEPMRWSEDFGHYLKHKKGSFLGLGTGENCPPLHDPSYDFPDSCIAIYQIFFRELIAQLHCSRGS